MPYDNLNRPLESDLPARVADQFVLSVSREGIHLRFEIDSLAKDFETYLDTSGDNLRGRSLKVDGADFELETAAGCYFGETFSRVFSGQWYGQLEPRALMNFYTTRIKFRDYLFQPFCWLGYRISNGIKEGTVTDCIEAVTPSMGDGIDHKKKRHDEIIEAGGMVFDNQIY